MKKKNFTTREKGFLLLFIFIGLFPTQPFSQERTWDNRQTDSGTIHSMGNGKMLVYGQGPEIINIFPGPYTTPSLFQLRVEEERPLETVATRENGTAIWEHQLSRNNEHIGRMQDFVDAEIPVFVRHMVVKDKLKFRLRLNDAVSVLGITEDKNKETGKMLLMTQPGTLIYQKYVYPRPLYHQIAWKGKVTVKKAENSESEFSIEMDEGESFIYFAGGPEYPEVVLNTREALNTDYDLLTARTRKEWNDFTSRRTDFDPLLPAGLPMREKLLQTIDDVSVMIKTQQADEGAVIAGYPYPLGYVRDQYGVSRGLIRLGLYEEAQNIINFYWNIWKKTGTLHCAQGVGVDGIFHIHENDEVESPGYLIIQAFDYARATGDQEFVKTIFPMLEWCWEVQKKHLAGGMIPFNGDETYVAGGILPRSTLNDGSAEATLLFIDGGEILLDWIQKEKLWNAGRVKKNRKILRETREVFRDNFWIDETLITNQPARLDYTDPPDFRHGICERGGPECLVYGKIGFGGIDWTQKDKNDRYQCAVCIQEGPLPEADTKIYKLISVSLIPLYFESDLIGAQELKPTVKKVFDNYTETGILTSQITESSMPESNASVGYDYGLILNALMETESEGAERIYRKTLSIVDEVGAWSEYYINDKPENTRCRPWESAINLEALLKFAENYEAGVNTIK